MADDNRFGNDGNRGGGYGQPNHGQDPLGPGRFADSQYGQSHQQPYAQAQGQGGQGGYGFERYGQPHGQFWSQGQDFGGPRGQGQGQAQGQNYGDPSHGQNQYGQAGGYSQSFGGQQQGPNQGFGRAQDGEQRSAAWRGPSQQSGQYQSYGGANRSYGRPDAGQGGGYYGQSQGGGSYSGQTGTGYGFSPAASQHGAQHAERPGVGDHQSLWDRARNLFTGDEAPREGAHRGRGPKSYSRSDERIRDDVNDRMTDDPFLDATDVEVSVQGGEVTLTGVVSSRADKRRAEDLADNVSGVKHVQNNLRVVSAATLNQTERMFGGGEGDSKK